MKNFPTSPSPVKIKKELSQLKQDLEVIQKRDNSRLLCSPTNLKLFSTQHKLDKVEKYQQMVELVSDIPTMKSKVQTYEIMANKIIDEREESRIVMDEYHTELRDPNRFAAKQELK